MSHKKLRPFIVKVSVLGYIPLPRICLYDFISKAIILLSRYSVNAHVSHPYSIIERTSDL